MVAIVLQAVDGSYMWNTRWSSAVQRISQGTPTIHVISRKWLEVELELNALDNPGSRQGSGNEKAAVSQGVALSVGLSGQVVVGTMNTISGRVEDEADTKSQLVKEICNISASVISCAHWCHQNPNKSPFKDWYLLLRAYACLSDNT